MYYSEYSFHMYTWNITFWADGKGIPLFSDLAGSAKEAAVNSEDPFSDFNYYMQENKPITAVLRTIAYMATGILGI